MEPVGEGIRGELHRLGIDSSAGVDQNDAWLAAVGPEIARNAWPARTQADGTLVVHVRDAIWGFELSQQAPEISTRLPGRPRLRFVPGPLPEDAPGEALPSSPAPSPEQVREADEMAASIDDRELRESVAKVIKAALVRTPDDRPF
ncbi:MAG TPA: DciA family protein [Gaiellaceae bacterium]|nr:DciA family protein [Gaiellaceae bacterium]